MTLKKTASIVAAAGVLTALAVPALAAETSIYGSIRLATFWNTDQPLQAVGAAKPDTNTDFDLRNQANSRLGVKATEGNFFGHVELGIGNPSLGTANNTIVYTRLAYGTYKFDFGTLLVGQTYTPYEFLSQQVALDDNANIGYGCLYDGRLPQLKFTLGNGLYIAAIRPGGAAAPAGSTAASGQAAPATLDTMGRVNASQTYLPKVAVGYEGKAGNFAFGGGILAQTYKTMTTATQEQVNSAMGYFHGTVTAGAVKVGFNVAAGQNLGDMSVDSNAAAVYNTVSKKIENSTTISGLVEAGLTLSPSLKLNAGLGYVQNDGKNANGTDWAKVDNKMAFFVNSPLTLAKNISVTPEFTYLDQLDEKNGDKGSKNYIYGAKWQMDF